MSFFLNRIFLFYRSEFHPVQGRGSHQCMYEHLVGADEEGARLISAVPTHRAGGYGNTLKHMKFHLNTRKKPNKLFFLWFFFFTVRVVKHWHWLL